jgi:hypothetical protein
MITPEEEAAIRMLPADVQECVRGYVDEIDPTLGPGIGRLRLENTDEPVTKLSDFIIPTAPKGAYAGILDDVLNAR